MILFLIVSIIFCIVYAARLKAKREEDAERMDNDIHRYESVKIAGLSAHDSSSAYSEIESLKMRYYFLSSQGYKVNKDVYRADLDEMKKHAKDLERWEKKAKSTLDQFLEYYIMVTESDFTDVDKIMYAKRRCISLWQDYFSIGGKLWIDYDDLPNMKEFMQKYLDDEYDPCMYSHNTLEKRLDDCIRQNRPEAIRKKALLQLIVDKVAESQSVFRSILLKTEFVGFSADEVRCCYKQLVTDNRLAEIKIGSRYFVSLSDKETAKRDKQKPKPICFQEDPQPKEESMSESISLEEFSDRYT